MSTMQLAEVRTKQKAMREDAGATSVTKDALAAQFHNRVVEAVGDVSDVAGQDDELVVLLTIGGEELTCPLVRVRGRTMEETLAEVRGWRKGDHVRLHGNLLWKTFDDVMQIQVLSASVEPSAE